MKHIEVTSLKPLHHRQKLAASPQPGLLSSGIGCLRRVRMVGLLLAAMLLAGLNPPQAIAQVYLTSTSHNMNYGYFGVLDVKTRTFNVIEEYAGNYSALAVHGGQIYAASGGTLYELGAHGLPTPYGKVEAAITGATFDSQGKFYATDRVTSNFGTISDPPTKFTPIGQIIATPSFNFYGSLAFHDGAFYHTRDAVRSGTAVLMRIDPATGAGTQLGPVNDVFSQLQLFSYEGRLLGISSLPATFAHLYEINTETSGVTDLGKITGALMPDSRLGGFTGAVSVPEPSLAGWRTVSLHPTDAKYVASTAYCVSGGQVGGAAFIAAGVDPAFRAALWNSPASAGFVSLADIPSDVRGVSGGIQAGDFAGFGAFWKGTTNWYFVAPGADAMARHLWGISGSWAAGQNTTYSNPGQSHPMLWQLMDTNSLPGIDLLPESAGAGCIFAITGASGGNPGRQAGAAAGGDVWTAAYWQGTAASYVDLHPNQVSNWVTSIASAIYGGQQGGWVEDDSRNRHAALWQGTATSFQDLHPSASVVPEDYDSFIQGMTDGIQVGYVTSPNGRIFQAALWEGTANSFLNLDTLLPAGYSGSQAYAAEWFNGELWVVGWAENTDLNRDEAMIWIYSAEAPRLASSRSGTNVVIAWPAAATGFRLEAKSDLKTSVPWTPVDTSGVVVEGTLRKLTIPAGAGNRFYRMNRANTVADIDGNVYQVVKIGTQEWLVGNLKTTKYRNGDSIPEVTVKADWGALTTGAWCYFNNDPALGAIYGKLYPWYAVNDPRGLAPAGWHVATTNDWGTLINSLGGDGLAGGKLKETGIAHWASPNTDATNEAGFTALPGSYRGYAGAFDVGHLGFWGSWWAATDGDEFSAWCFSMFNDSGETGSFADRKGKGFSVRCVRD